MAGIAVVTQFSHSPKGSAHFSGNGSNLHLGYSLSGWAGFEPGHALAGSGCAWRSPGLGARVPFTRHDGDPPRGVSSASDSAHAVSASLA
jgi:hypothetical protein